MAETLPKLTSSRAGYRAHLTRTLNKAKDLMKKEAPTEMDVVSLNSIIEQLTRKKSILTGLDEKIAALIEEPKDLEQEIYETEEIHDDILETTSQISRFIHVTLSPKKSAIQPPSPTHQESPQMVYNETPLVPSNMSEPSSSGSQENAPSTSQAATGETVNNLQNSQPAPNTQSTPLTPQLNVNHSSRLPKLNLPSFSGNPLKWSTFWDSFEAAVHSNTTLGGVQKFSYLKAQLTGDASRAIAGFPLSNVNYEQAIKLLKERFGQPSKIISAHMQALLDIASPINQLTSLQLFYDTMENHVRGLESLGRSHESYGDLLVPIILGKLPHELRKNLAREHDNPEWKFQELREAIVKEIRILEAGAQLNDTPYGVTPTVTSSFLTQTQEKQPHSGKSSKPESKKCLYCKGPHPSYSCQVVTDARERWAKVKTLGHCFNCLGKHKSSVCQSKFRCHKCKGKHHTSLCLGPTDPANSPWTTPDTAAPTHSRHPSTVEPTFRVHASLAPINQTNVPVSSGQISLLKTAIATVGHNHIHCEANILFDEGAQRSFITQTLADQLGIRYTESESIALSAFGAHTSSNRQLPMANITIVTTNGEHIPVRVLVIDQIATPLQNRFRQQIQTIPHLRGLPLAHPVTSDEDFEISLLIGADHYWDIVKDTVIRGQGPTAVESKLGYLISGPLQTNCVNRTDTVVNLLQTLSSTTAAERDLEHFWSLESIGISPPAEMDDQESFLQHFQRSSITRMSDGSYSAKFPWKEDCPALPSNYGSCARRTRAMVRRLAQTPSLLRSYGEIIKEHEKRGFIERVDNVDSLDRAHYLPHHAVKKESATTPIRVVFDCSSRSTNNSPSLNDCLMVGPPFLSDMCSIIIRFRSFTYGLSTDIEKAFLHVGLDGNDRDFTRFFWLSDPKNPESEFQVFRFKTVLFGSTSSPFMLNATLHHHLDNHSTPVAKDIRDNMYVDNVISGSDRETDIISYYQESRSIMNAANFNLRSWASNSPQLRERTEQDQTADTSTVVNILGLRWHPVQDTLALAPKEMAPPSCHPTSKRDVLQLASKTYDPLGFISPVTVKAKLFIQELWQRKLEWDEPLPTELEAKWDDIAQDIQEASKLVLPRRFFSQVQSKTQPICLHVFADASPKAYGAVAYLSTGDQSSLVMSKSRVAPLKKLTLPQLELMAASICTRLAHFAAEALKSRFPNLTVHLWSDSEIVLHWLHSSKPLKQFVANRTKEIKALFPVAVWNHCPTHENPADLLTRGITTTQLHTSSLWQRGPQWLPLAEQWPSWNPSKILHLHLCDIADAEDTDATANNTKTTTDGATQTDPAEKQLGIHNLIDVSRFSTLSRLLTVTAYVLRFVKNLQNHATKTDGPLSVQERQEAQRKWIQNSQALIYAAEIANLQSKSRTRLTLVKQLHLFLDADGFLRCGGRIHNAQLAESAKFPYLLPPNHPFTALIVYEIHRRQLHSGVNVVVTMLRQTFWITSIRQYVRKLLRRCVTCRKVQGTAFRAPDPAPLPKLRVQEAIPFSVTGVDFTGPLYVRSENGTTKSYICLFTCAVTRAVHLEVVSDLSEQSFLQAFRRFSSRRSLPHHMISDNASTFLASSETLNDLFQSPSLKEQLSRQGVEWKFIPKRAPWYGGFWERLIGLTKRAIKKTLGKASITLTELQTLTTEVEAVLNDRPITYVSSDCVDEEPLTPSHLLNGRRITSLPYPITDDPSDPDYGSASDMRQRVTAQAHILERFWKRWRHEYLTSLREFHRTTGTNEQSIKTGDVVLVYDEGPRSSWKLAVIEDLIRGGDGLVRAAHIRTSTGYTNRPVSKLYPLEVTASPSVPRIASQNCPEQQCTAVTSTRPRRAAATDAMGRISEWARRIRAPAEDVE